MHAPHRTHVLPRTDAVVRDCPSPDSTSDKEDESSFYDGPRSARTGSQGSIPASSPLAQANPLSQRGQRDVEYTVVAHKLRTDHLTPRAMWRAPTPRRLPLPSLLPALSAPRTSRVSRPLGAASTAMAVSPVRKSSHKGTPAEAVDLTASIENSSGYGKEYVRLVFDSAPSLEQPSSLLASEPHALPTPGVAQPAHGLHFPPASSTTETITDAQAVAVLAHLPDPIAAAATTPPAASQRTGSPSPSNGFLQQPPLPSRAPLPLAKPDVSLTDAWWSTLDGTLSAHGSPQLSPLPGVEPMHRAVHSQHRQPPPHQQNLNDTLGRADRAAMVLSVSYPQHSAESSRGIESGPGDSHAHEAGEDFAAANSVAAAVAALAARLSRAAGKGTNINNNTNSGVYNNSVLSDVSANTVAHQTTLQELRDTLRMTDPNLLGSSHERLHGLMPRAEPANNDEIGADGLRSSDARQSRPLAERDGRALPIASIVKPASHSSRGTWQGGADAKMASGLSGAGTRRTRDALARLYAESPATPSVFTGATAAPPLMSHSLSFLNRPGPSFGAPAPQVSTDDAMRTTPWQCEPLTLATVERRYGPCEAAHVVHTRRAQHTSGYTLAKEGSAAGAARALSARVALGLPSPPSPTSSISTALLSCVSLSSSIFVRELGDAVALRRSYMAAMSNAGLAAARLHDTSLDVSPMPGRDAVLRVQAHHNNSQAQKGATSAVAAEQYRREQQRLYASHLTTKSPAAVGDDVIEPHLDVDYLFSDIKPKPRVYKLRGAVKTSREDGGTKPSASEPLRDGGSSSSTSTGTATVSSGRHDRHPTPEARDALHDALQARQALLRRHVQQSPSWERLLYKVRQWCDRTQVMIRLENGECVEQAGAGRPSRTTTSLSSRASGNEVGSPTDIGPREASIDVEGAAEGFNGNVYSPYVDDPALAHDLLMQQVAQEVEDIQRQNTLHQYRERQQQWEAALNESALVVAEPSEAPLNGSLGPGDRTAFGKPKSTTAASSWARASFRGDASSVLGDRTSDTQASSSQDGCVHPLAVASESPTSQGYHDVVKTMRGTVEHGGEDGDNGAVQLRPSNPLASALPIASPAQRGPASQHAALCAKLSTWGAPLEGRDEEEEDRAGDADDGDSSHVEPSFATEGQRREKAGTLVLWRSAAGRISRESDAGVGLRTRLASFQYQGNPLSAPPAADASRTPFFLSKRPSRASCFRLSGVEKDLLVYVLTCGSSSHTSSSASDEGLLSLLHAAGHCRSTAPQPAVDENEDLSAAQQALLAAQAILKDGFDAPFSAQQDESSGFQLTQEHQEGPKRNNATGAEKRSPPLMWEPLLNALLEGYNVFNLPFLKQLHEVLWAYEEWLQTNEKEKCGVWEGAKRRTDVTILSAATGATASTTKRKSYAERPPPVVPLTLTISPPASSFTRAKNNAAEGSDAATVSSVTADAAELFSALARTPTLLLWLLNAHQSSPTSSWMDIADTIPGVQESEWHDVVSRFVEEAIGVAAAPSQRTSHSGPSVSPPSSAQPATSFPQSRRGTSYFSEELSATANISTAAVVSAFACDISAGVSSLLWRQRVLHEFLKRALSSMESAPETAIHRNNSSSVPTAVPSRVNATPPPPSSTLPAPFPRIGSTPYLPDEEGRATYPLDMRSGYLFSSLAREDVENRVGPQMREARKQFAEALRLARSAGEAADVSPTPTSKANTSLPLALQLRVYWHRLAQIEQRFVSLLSSLWSQELTIRAFNRHVADFNDFTRAEQQRWGPLYCSSLRVAYCVCEELAEKKMENLSLDLLPFVSVVAAFMSCRGAHRELRAKLRAVMLDLIDRAKKVRVHLDSLTWQGTREEVLAEAVAASLLAPRRAGAVVSCLATEADVVGVPLTEVALPAVQLKFTLPLAASEE